MEPEGTLPCSQGPDAGLYNQPGEFNTHPHIALLLRCNLILPTHVRVGRQSDLFPLGISTKILYAFLMSQVCYMSCPSYRQFAHPSNIWWRAQIMKFSGMQFCPFCCYFLSLSLSYVTLFSTELSFLDSLCLLM